jgi:hypothetical protein
MNTTISWGLLPAILHFIKVFQQTADAFLDARERDRAIFTALERRQGVEKEQRLVWGPFFAPAVDVDGGEAVEEVLVTGLVGRGWPVSIVAVLGWGSWMATAVQEMAAAHAAAEGCRRFRLRPTGEAVTGRGFSARGGR